MNKKLAPLRVQNDVTHAIQLKLHERMKKSRFEVIIVTSYGRNKNLNEIKKHNRKNSGNDSKSRLRERITF